MLLASGEIFGLPIPVVLFGAYLLCKYFTDLLCKYFTDEDNQPQKLTTNTWTWTWKEKKGGFHEAVKTVVESRLGYIRETGNSPSEQYRIGRDDKTWTKADDKKPEATQWRECARKLHVNYRQGDQETVIEVFIRLAGQIEFNDAGKKWFLARAEDEINRLGPLIDEYYAIINSPAGYHGSSTTNQAAEETAQDSHEQESEEPSFAEQAAAWTLQAALDELGVDGNASWQQVQRAYRLLCKQYHPDTIASKDYPPHVVHLMEEKFKRITQAYDLLKEVMATA